MIHDDAPRWDLLPHDPEAFFGLDGEFDRRELKRRYNRLIRQFKPEQHPAEFQQIRRAYEELDNALRYDEPLTPLHGGDWERREQRTSPPPEPAVPPSLPQPPPEQPPPRTRPAEPPVEEPVEAALAPLHERLGRESPVELFRELRAGRRKTPHDYFALAVLSDVVGAESALTFPYWLLEGLAAFPDDRGLLRLLHVYLHAPANGDRLDAAMELLLATVDTIRDDRFFYLTEGAWDRLLRTVPFEDFADTLYECEAKLLDYRIEARLTFYVHVLKAALWRAPEEWIDDAEALLAENFQYLPARLEADHEFLDLLWQYRRIRHEFVSGHALRQQMDEAMRQYCTEDQATGDRAVLAFQQRLVSGDEDVLTAFPADAENPPDLATALALWESISAEVNERVEIRPPVVIADAEAKVHTMLLELAKATGNSLLHGLLSLTYISFALSMLGFAIALIVFVVRMFKAWFVDGEIGVGFARLLECGLIVVGAVLCVFAMVVVSGWLARRIYRRRWRGELLRFLKRTHVPWEIVLAQAEVLVAAKKIECDAETYKLFRADSALRLISQAQQALAGF